MGRSAGAWLALAAMAAFAGVAHLHGGHEHHDTPQHAAVSGCLGKDGVPHFHRVLSETLESCLACTAGLTAAPPPPPPQAGSVSSVGVVGAAPPPTWLKSLGHPPSRPRAPPFAG